MGLLLCLSVLAACAVVLCGTNVVITAPSTVTDTTGDLETREQGPTAWICSALAVNEPWNAYANIRSYLEGGNAENKDYSSLVLYPVMELYHTSESRLCVYLPSEDHCFPPPPNTNAVKAVKQLVPRKYFDMRFWGQASNVRLEYYKEKLIAALNAQNKPANFDIFFVSYFSDHVREVRYDPMSSAFGGRAATQNEEITCSLNVASSFNEEIIFYSGVEYTSLSIEPARLLLVDVKTIPSSSSTQAACTAEAYDGAYNAFSFVNDTCNVYNFRKTFCPCIGGDMIIYVNRRLVGKDRDLEGSRPEYLQGKTVIFTEIPLTELVNEGVLTPTGSPGQDGQCETANLAGGGRINVDDNINCYDGTKMDIQNCQQVCNGDGLNMKIIGTGVSDSRYTPIESVCGQTLTAPIGPKMVLVSHSGYGCSFYPKANTADEEECIVNLVQAPGKDYLVLHISQVQLASTEDTCLDSFWIHMNNLPDGDGPYCTDELSTWMTFTSRVNLTIKYRRSRNDTVDRNLIGFSISVHSV